MKEYKYSTFQDFSKSKDKLLHAKKKANDNDELTDRQADEIALSFMDDIFKKAQAEV